MMTKLQQQMEFLTKIDDVKGILRQSVIMGDIEHRENDAEHSWHMAICAMTLAEYFTLGKVNMERVLMMILLHDVIEVYAGDTPAYSQYSKDEKHAKEVEAAHKIFGMLPDEQYRQYFALWDEFERYETIDSKYANVMDRFQGFMQNTTSDGHTWRKFNPSEAMVLDRMKPVIDYAPQLFEEIMKPYIQKYKDMGIIK